MSGHLSQLRYDGSFLVNGSPAELWDDMAQLIEGDEFERHLFRYRLQGRALETGSRTDVTLDTRFFPFTIRMEVLFLDCTRPSGVALFFHGDVEGAGSVRLVARDADTEVLSHWQVLPKGKAIRLAHQLGRPAVMWAQEQAVQAIVWLILRRLKRHRLESRTGPGVDEPHT